MIWINGFEAGLNPPGSRHLPIVLVKVAYYASGSALFLSKLCSLFKIMLLFKKIILCTNFTTHKTSLKMYFIDPGLTFWARLFKTWVTLSDG